MAKILDKEGYDTLQVISGADNFNRWMFDTLKPYIKGNVLEAGSGIGNISGLLLQMQQLPFSHTLHTAYSPHASHGPKSSPASQLWNITSPSSPPAPGVVLSDISDDYVDILRKKFKGVPSFTQALVLDLNDPQFDTRHIDLFEKFDTVVALNVIEHVRDDRQAVANCRKLLRPGGSLIVLVPAYQALYNRFDKELGHYLRYNRRQLEALLSESNECSLQVIKSGYFNLAGIAGWIFSGNLLRKKTIPEGQMRVFNALVPFFKVLDRLTLSRCGLSVWAVARRRQ